MTPFLPESVRDLAQKIGETVAWLVVGLLPKGVLALLAAYPKVGKSTLVYQLAVAVATGRSFLGRTTHKGGVLIIVAEERMDDALRRLRDLGMQDDDPVWLWANGVNDTPADRAKIEQFIRDKKIALVVVDTLASYLLLEDETNNSQATARIKPYVDMAHRTDATIVLVHHERKNSGENDSTRAIRGGSAILGLADIAFQLRHESGGTGTTRRLTVVGRYSEIPSSLKLDFKNDEYVSLGTPEEATQKAKRDKIMAVLPATGLGLTVEEVSEKTEYGKRATRAALDSALDAGVHRTGSGKRGDPYRYLRIVNPDSPNVRDEVAVAA